MGTWLISFCVAMILPAIAFALGPHELLILANRRSKDSVEIAKAYVSLRGVPEANLVYLDVPQTDPQAPFAISPEDFTHLVFEPAVRHARERGIDDHILAWIYSTDFPVQVKSEPTISVTGLTFLRNRLPDPKDVTYGTYVSPLFCGADSPTGRQYLPQSLDLYREWLGREMPLPSMFLGYTGERGNTREEVLRCLETGKRSDGTQPTGTVYFVVSDDIRSKCREWQFPKAEAELRSLGVRAMRVSGLDDVTEDVIGLMMGTASPNTEQIRRFLPGCMAEHLTSAGAVFNSDDQIKLTAWVKAGATGSAGAVTEPFAKWTKFPSAIFFVFYASGCGMLESFFQSIRCPLQIMLVGDPLAEPWAPPRCDVFLAGLGKVRVSGTVKLAATPRSADGSYHGKRQFLVDGRTVGARDECEWDTRGVSNGVHHVRAVVYRTGLVRAQSYRERDVIVANGEGDAHKISP